MTGGEGPIKPHQAAAVGRVSRFSNRWERHHDDEIKPAGNGLDMGLKAEEEVKGEWMRVELVAGRWWYYKLISQGTRQSCSFRAKVKD